MTPSIERKDGQLKIRIIKGLTLTPVQLVGVLVGIGILFALPDIARSTQGIPIRERPIYRGMVLGLAAIGLNLLLRHANLVSFGHAAFFGTGAYTVAIIMQFYGIQSIYVLVPLGTIAATLMAVLIGYFTLPHEGLYFALVTLAFGQLLYSIPRGITELGGTDGLNALVSNGSVLERYPTIGGIPLNGTEPIHNSILFAITIVVALVLLLIMYRIVRSPFGRALDAIGQERTRARFLGLPVKRYVWAAFIISGFYGGVAGSLYAVFFTSGISPDQTLQVFVSGDILFITILGGFNTLTGPLIGGIIFEVLTNITSGFTLTGPGGEKGIGRLLTGIVLLVIVFGFPSGVVGSLKKGGRVREVAVTIKNDPSVIEPWLSRAVTGIVDAGKRATQSIRILILRRK